ncbi:MAG: hypothetical protein IT494_01325 [Gammaproteobacteria bacterium]|nr:hypothetical protein [Gammaproteobacteria bacterium]
MADHNLEDAWSKLVDGLQHLESLLPNTQATAYGSMRVMEQKVYEGSLFRRFELEEEIRELEEFIANAGDPEDEHSLAALTFLQTELIRKQSLLDNL